MRNVLSLNKYFAFHLLNGLYTLQMADISLPLEFRVGINIISLFITDRFQTMRKYIYALSLVLFFPVK